MSDFQLSPQAFQDVDSIWETIAQDNLIAADRLRHELFDAFEKLAEMPSYGTFVRIWPQSLFGFGSSTPPTSSYTDRIHNR